jgi:hypothetical protein
MLIINERQSAIRTIGGWATFILLETGAISECQEHGWMKNRTDPHARHRAIEIARSDPPPGVSQGEALAAVESVPNSIGDTCPECPPNDD